MTRLSTSQPGDKWLACLGAAWTTVILAADLKAGVVTYIHWIVSAVAVLLAAPYLFPIQKATGSPARLPAWLLVGAICVPTLYGASVGYSLAEAGKLFVILLLALPLFVAQTKLARSAFLGFIIAVCLNAAFLLAGMAGLGGAEIMAADRWGTILNYPGSLWRAAITVWFFAAYLVLVRRSLPYATLLAASTLCIYMDAARTALLVLCISLLFLGVVLCADGFSLVRARVRRWKRSLLVAALALALVAIAVAASRLLWSPSNLESVGVGRLGQLASVYQEGGFEGLEVADAIRFQMLADVSDAIRSHPLLGSGVLTTKSETIVGPMSIHMTYLQVWADLGLVGLVAYAWLVWGWIVRLPRALGRIRRMEDPKERALYYNSILLMIVYGLSGFFHPLSTEWSEWVLFIIPCALFWEAANCKDVTPQPVSPTEAGPCIFRYQS